MLTSRRVFLGGLSACAAISCRGLFAAEANDLSGERPDLVFGVLSDVHIALAKGGRKLSETRNTDCLERALAYFRDQGVHAVVIAGDITNNGLFDELKAVADAWYRVFPDDKAPDGHKVERIFVFGNHDWSGVKRGATVYGDEATVRAEALVTDPKKFWEACFHEEWREFYTREVNGYRFVGAHWCKGSGRFGDCNGSSETFISGLAERYAALKRQIDPSRPFIHVQHPHPRGTVHGEGVWGQDDGESTKVLSAYPNAVSFSGHSHTSLLDEKSIWQGGFTAVGTATLQNVGPAGIQCGLEAGYENYETPGRKMGPNDALKVMAPINRFESKQGQLVRVFPDRIVFTRRDFLANAALEDDLVLPLTTTKEKPYSFSLRTAAAQAPAFARGAALAFRTVEAKMRGAKKGAAPKQCVEIAIPPAIAGARCVRYEIVTKGRDGAELKVALLSEGFRFAASDKRVQTPAKCRIARDRLAPGEIPFSVCAYSTWGKSSEPLKGVFTA